MKKIIRLTESDLNSIIKESVYRILNEENGIPRAVQLVLEHADEIIEQWSREFSDSFRSNSLGSSCEGGTNHEYKITDADGNPLVCLECESSGYADGYDDYSSGGVNYLWVFDEETEEEWDLENCPMLKSFADKLDSEFEEIAAEVLESIHEASAQEETESWLWSHYR